MRNKLLFTVFLLVISFSVYQGWGDKGHKIVASYAMKNLTGYMNIPKDWQKYVVDHSVDPDYRKGADKGEAPRHFIDIDYYKEFLRGEMIQNLDSLKKKYPDSVITKMGTLPWAVEETFNNLVKAFKSKKKQDILLYMSDLAHYVGDSYQPQHTNLNYNGQLTGQKGLHFRYEIDMLDSNVTEINAKYEGGKPGKINSIREATFDAVTRANTFADVISTADKIALQNNGTGKYDNTYRKLMWFRTRYMTIDQLNLAGNGLASAIYTAWLNAGKPDLRRIK